MAPVVHGTSLIRLFVTITPKTEIMPKRGPKKAPAIGAKKSKSVKETFEPASLLTGTCKEAKPKMENKTKKTNTLLNLAITGVSLIQLVKIVNSDFNRAKILVEY